MKAQRIIAIILITTSFCFTSCLKDANNTIVLQNLKPNTNGSDGGDNGVIPTDVIPNEIRDEFSDKMPIYPGKTPPDISGQYLCSPMLLTSSSLSYDNIGQQYADLYLAFIKTNGKMSYKEKTAVSQAIGDDVSISIVGKNKDFTAYFVATGTSNGIYTKTTTLISGTITSGGIQNFHYAFILLEKGPDPDYKLVDVNTYRVFNDSDNLTVNYNWLDNKKKATNSDCSLPFVTSKDMSVKNSKF